MIVSKKKKKKKFKQKPQKTFKMFNQITISRRKNQKAKINRITIKYHRIQSLINCKSKVNRY